MTLDSRSICPAVQQSLDKAINCAILLEENQLLSPLRLLNAARDQVQISGVVSDAI